MVLQPSRRVIEQTKVKERIFFLTGEVRDLNAELMLKTRELERFKEIPRNPFASLDTREKNERQIETLGVEIGELKKRLSELNKEVGALIQQKERLFEHGEATVDLTAGTEERFSTKPVGYLLSRIGLMCLLAVMGLALWFEQPNIAVLAALVVTAALTSRLWSRFSLARLECSRRLSETRLFPGEKLDLTFKVTNRKILPLPWLQIYDDIPLTLTQGVTNVIENYAGSHSLSYAAIMPWYSSITWKNRLTCSKRGYYTLGPVSLFSGDMLGFYPRSEYRRELEHVVVYPRLYPVGDPDLPSLYPMGETKASRRIFEDPSRPIGVRDYNYQDSLRYIHWKASARQQKLMVKVFEPTTTLKVAFFLGVDTFRIGDSIDEDIFELAISAVASLSQYVIERRSSAGVFVNSRLHDQSGPLKILPGGNAGHFVNILEGLAKVTNYPVMPFAEFLHEERASLPWGVTTVGVVSEASESLPPLLTELKRRGNKVLVLEVGRTSDIAFDVPVYHIDSPDDLGKISFGGRA